MVKPTASDEQLELKLAREFTLRVTLYLRVLSKLSTMTVKPSLSPIVMLRGNPDISTLGAQ